MRGNAFVCGSGRTAAIVKVILSPRPTMTNGEKTGQFTYYCRLGQVHHPDHASTIVPGSFIPNPPPVLMAFFHISSGIFGICCEKNSIMPSYINLNPAKAEGLDFNLFWFTSCSCVLSGVLHCQAFLVKSCYGSRPLDLATCFMDCLGGCF